MAEKKMLFINSLRFLGNRENSGQFGCLFAFKLCVDRTECRGRRVEPKPGEQRFYTQVAAIEPMGLPFREVDIKRGGCKAASFTLFRNRHASPKM
jgi:hypothetical protein